MNIVKFDDGTDIISSVLIAVAAVSLAGYWKITHQEDGEEGEEEEEEEIISNVIKLHEEEPQHEETQHEHEHEHEDLLSSLPSELVEIIASKLDIVTLGHCAAILPHEFHPILPTLTSLSMTVPSKLLLPPVDVPFMNELIPQFRILNPNLRKILQLHIVKPSWSVPRVPFLKRFSCLESLSVQLPPRALAADYLTNPKVWFRWDSHMINVDKTRNFIYYYVSVHATIIVDDAAEDEIIQPKKSFTFAGILVSLDNFRHLSFHANTILSLFPSFFYRDGNDHPQETETETENPHPKLRTIVSKDLGGNGRLTLYSDDDVEDDDDDDKFEQRCKLSYLSKELSITTSSGSNLRIKDAWLSFMYCGYVGNNNNEVEVDDDRILMGCLDRGDYPREDLKEAVTKILSHADTVHQSHHVPFSYISFVN